MQVAPESGLPDTLAEASSTAVFGGSPGFAGNALSSVNFRSNEKRIRCGALVFEGSSNSGMAWAGTGPPGVAGEGWMLTPETVPSKAGVGIFTPQALKESMLKPSRIR